MSRVRLLLPAYNEELCLPSLLARAADARRDLMLDLDVLVVNDGSQDQTAQVARDFQGDLRVVVLDLPENQGLAGALECGLKETLVDLGDDDILVCADADDSHNPYSVGPMVARIREGADIVIGSRFQPTAQSVGLDLKRTLISYCASWVFRLVVGLPGVLDYTCGFRAIRVETLRRALSHYGPELTAGQGFSCSAGLLLKLSRFHPVITEVPITLRYDRKLSASKINVSQTIPGVLKLLLGYNRFTRTS